MNAPQIVGIVNITEDSFSDGGRFLAAKNAIDHAEQLAVAGAHYLELGPASSHPDSQDVSATEQIERLAPVIVGLASSEVPIAVDATDSEVQRFALEAGVSLLNDIRGFPDAGSHAMLADHAASLVVVHSLLGRERAERNEATPDQVLDSIERFFESRLTKLVRAGVAEDRLIVDPGMGFFLGSNPQASIAVLQRIPELRARFGRPVFIGVSRKSFLRAITGRDAASIQSATLAAELFAAEAGAEYLRTHDVASLCDALKLATKLKPN